jgi:hypothetical protein
MPHSIYRRTFGFPSFRRVGARFAFASRLGARPFGRPLGATRIAALLTLTAAASIVEDKSTGETILEISVRGKRTERSGRYGSQP